MDNPSKINNVTVFYSWQSDLPAENNKKAIKGILRNAFTRIEDESKQVEIFLDEATRNTAGSPDIPSTIFDKIESSDIFICDLTTINSDSPKDIRKVPNPNVLIELGYAIALLGWDRIIILFNKAHGNFPDDLPFDIAKRRIANFKIESGHDQSAKGNVQAILKTAIKTIIDKKPLKPHEIKGLNPIEKKRRRDILNIKWALKSINIPIMDDFISELPFRINSKIFHFWEGFNGVLNSSLFHLYDSTALKLFIEIHTHWENTISFGHRYNAVDKYGNAIFGNPDNPPIDQRAQDDYKFIGEERLKLKKDFRNLLDYIRTKYMDIDLDEMSQYALNEYNNFHKEFHSNFE